MCVFGASASRNRPTNRLEQKLQSLTIYAIAHHDETDHRIVQQLGGRALLDRNSLQSVPTPGTSHGRCGRSGGITNLSSRPLSCYPSWGYK